MNKAFLAASILLLFSTPLATPLIAQSKSPNPPRRISSCASNLRGGGPNCAPDRRLLIVVTLNGAEAPPEILQIVGMGSMAAGAFALTPSNATPTDSAVFAVMDVSRDAQGNYRLDQRIAGSMVKSPDNCRAFSTGGADDMGFGAHLALESWKLVRCVQSARGAPRN